MPSQGETLSQQKEHADQAALLERAKLILDFESLIDPGEDMPGHEALYPPQHTRRFVTLHNLVHHISLATTAEAVGLWFWAAYRWSERGDTESATTATATTNLTQTTIVAPCEWAPGIFMQTEGATVLAGLVLAVGSALLLHPPTATVCPAIIALVCGAAFPRDSSVHSHALGMTLLSLLIWLGDAAIVCTTRWPAAKRALLLVCAPGGWSILSLACAVAVLILWTINSGGLDGSADHGCMQMWWEVGAASMMFIWILVEVFEKPESRQWPGRIPHDKEEGSPYLHVLSERDHATATAVLTSDFFVEQEQMVEAHMDRGIEALKSRLSKQFGRLRVEMDDMKESLHKKHKALDKRAQEIQQQQNTLDGRVEALHGKRAATKGNINEGDTTAGQTFDSGLDGPTDADFDVEPEPEPEASVL